MKDMCLYRPVTSIFVQIKRLETFGQFAPPKPIISVDFCRNAAKYCEDVRSVGIKSEKDQGRRRVGGWWMGQQTQDVHPGVLVSRVEPQVNADLFYRRWSYWMRQNTIISTFNPMVWFGLPKLFATVTSVTATMDDNKYHLNRPGYPQRQT